MDSVRKGDLALAYLQWESEKEGKQTHIDLADDLQIISDNYRGKMSSEFLRMIFQEKRPKFIDDPTEIIQKSANTLKGELTFDFLKWIFQRKRGRLTGDLGEKFKEIAYALNCDIAEVKELAKEIAMHVLEEAFADDY